MTQDGLTIEGARKELDEFTKTLEGYAPNPVTNRLLAIDREYTPVELRNLLQYFGSYIASLTAILGRIEAEQQIVTKGLKAGMSIAALDEDLKSSTVAGKEAELFKTNENFAALKRLEIRNEARIILVRSWVKAYEAAYTSASRLVTVEGMEATLATTRVP